MRILIGSLSVLAVIIVGALIAPQFIDWQKYKPLITTEVQKATGLNVTIDGNISMSVFPLPHVTVEQLTVEAPLKKKFDNLIKIEKAAVSVELLPLLEKKVNVKSVSLIKPDITIEILEDGTPSWMTDQLSSGQDNQEEGAGDVLPPSATNASSNKPKQDIALNAVEIKQGRIHFINHQSNAEYMVSNANIDLNADTLDGPFSINGGITYDDAEIFVNASIGDIKNTKAIPVKATIKVAGSNITYDGAVFDLANFGVQGQLKIKSDNPYKAAQAFSFSLPSEYNQSLNLSSIITADKNTIKMTELDFSYDKLQAGGSLSVENLVSQNPVTVTGELQSSSIIDTAMFTSQKQSSKQAATDSDVLKTSGQGKNTESIIPRTLSVPFPLSADVSLNIAGIKHENATFKNISLTMKKQSDVINAAFRINEIPGQGRVNGALKIDYASQSGNGPVLYADPTVTFDIDGNIGQLASFLKDIAPSANTKDITNVYRSASFDLDGNIIGNAVKVNKGVIKLDETNIGLSGSYAPSKTGGKPNTEINLQIGTLNIDQLMGKKKSSSSNDITSEKSAVAQNKSDPLKVLKDFSLPVDVKFDISAQKLIANSQTFNGVRLVGSMIGSSLSLSTASINDFSGAALSAKGKVDNINTMSGIDANLGLKTSNLGSFAEAVNLDLTNLPSGISALDVTLEGKGTLNKLSFATNVKALGGQLDADGIAKDLLGTPSYSDLALRIKHPNGVKAIQVFSPEFKGVEGLAQAIDVYTKVNTNGKIYDLKEIQATIGQTNIAGNLNIDASNKIMGIKGDIKGKTIQLDSLLGAEKSSGNTSARSSGGSSASQKSSSGKWTESPIDLGWMNTMNVDVGLSANRLIYGKWNFTNPTTRIKVANGQLDIDSLKAGIFGGTANLTSKVTAEPVSLSLSTKMTDINLESLAGALSGSNRLKAAGNVSFETSVKGTGKSSRALVSSLNGTANLDGNNVVLKGFDLAKLAQGLSTDQKLITSLQNFAQGALKSGETRFDTMTGDYKIEQGIVNIVKMQMDGPAAIIDSTGQVDLPKWFINVDNKVTIKDVPDLDPLDVKIKGSLDNPTTLGTNIVEDYIQDKLKRKLGKELPGLLGDDVTNKLQQFGILPQKQKTPANDNAAPKTTGSEGEVTPQRVAPQKEAPKKIEKPEDAVEQLLNSDNAEDAVNNLIKGLF